GVRGFTYNDPGRGRHVVCLCEGLTAARQQRQAGEGHADLHAGQVACAWLRYSIDERHGPVSGITNLLIRTSGPGHMVVWQAAQVCTSALNTPGRSAAGAS